MLFSFILVVFFNLFNFKKYHIFYVNYFYVNELLCRFFFINFFNYNK